MGEKDKECVLRQCLPWAPGTAKAQQEQVASWARVVGSERKVCPGLGGKVLNKGVGKGQWA